MIKKLSDRIFYMPYEEESGRPVLGVVCGERCSLVIDAGNSPKHAAELLASVSELNVSPLKYVAVTHWHWDHVFGIEAMNLTSICHENTNEKLKYMKTLKWDDASINDRVKKGEEAPFCHDIMRLDMNEREELKLRAADIVFNDRLTVDLGGTSCIIENVKGDHSEDSCIVYIPSEKVMFLGDALSENIYKGEKSYTQDKLTALISRIKTYDTQYYITAHKGLYDCKEMDKILKELLETAEFVDDADSFERVAKMYHNYYGRYPKDDIIYKLNCFINGNKKKFSGTIGL